MREEIFEECLEYYQNSNGKIPFWEKLAVKYEKYGYGEGKKNKEKLRRHFHSERKKRGISKDGDSSSRTPYRESQELKSDGSIILDRMFDISEEDSRDPSEIIKAAGLNPDKLTLVNAKFGGWDSGNKTQRTGRVIVKPKDKNDFGIKEVDAWFEKNKNRLSGARNIRLEKHEESGDLIAELLFADLHFGKIGIDETDGVSTLLEDFMFVAKDMFDNIKDLKLKKIVICGLGDIFHYDNKKRQTTKLTQVTSDGRSPQVIYDEALCAFINIINMFSELANVLYIHIPGNHDALTSYYFAKSLEMYYINSECVEIDAGHESRKFRLFGKCLIAWVHGEANRKRLESNFLQIEAKELWSKALFKEVHVGHLHSLKTSNSGGVVFRNILSLSKMDEWHSDSLYIDGERAIQGFIWDEKKGLKIMLFSRPEEN